MLRFGNVLAPETGAIISPLSSTQTHSRNISPRRRDYYKAFPLPRAMRHSPRSASEENLATRANCPVEGRLQCCRTRGKTARRMFRPGPIFVFRLFPQVALRVLQLANKENVQLHELSGLISSDPALPAKFSPSRIRCSMLRASPPAAFCRPLQCWAPIICRGFASP